MIRALPRFKGAIRSNLSCAFRLSHLPRRWCSSSLVDRRLSKALEKEIEHEATVADDKKVCPTFPGFELVNDGMNVLLKRQLENETITVRFHIQLSTGEDSESEEEEGSTVAAVTSNFSGLKNLFGASNEPEEVQVDASAITNRYFTAVVEKGSEALFFDCSWTSAKLQIMRVTFCQTASAAHRLAVFGDEADFTAYEGPEVSDLSDTLSTLWYEYLNSRGVDASMGVFMTSYSKFKEQQEYVAWLDQILKFVQR